MRVVGQDCYIMKPGCFGADTLCGYNRVVIVCSEEFCMNLALFFDRMRNEVKEYICLFPPSLHEHVHAELQVLEC